MVQVLVKVKTFLNQYYKKAIKYPHIWIGFVILFAVISLIWLPYWRVSQFGINNATENATLENQYRATFAQILGGVAIGISLYYAWQRNNIAQEGQITDRFTRAIDQLGAIDHLGNPAIEIRLGGIYALGRIANESEKDYWSIMEILTSYIRKNSSLEIENITVEDGNNQKKLSLDIQSILTVIQKSKYPSNDQELNRLDLHRLDLHGTYLREAQLKGANLEIANLKEANLEYANLQWTNLTGANLKEAVLFRANLKGANLNYALLEGADLQAANLEIIRDFDDLFGLLENSNPVKVASLERAILADANLRDADLEGVSLEGAMLTNTNFEGAILKEVNLKKAILDGANLEGADLKGAKNLTIEQLSEVKTLYNAKLDDELRESLKNKYPDLYDHLIEKQK